MASSEINLNCTLRENHLKINIDIDYISVFKKFKYRRPLLKNKNITTKEFSHYNGLEKNKI